MKTTNTRNKGKSLLKALNDYTVIDLETTGRYINDCMIIEMSAVRVRDDQIVDTYTTLVNPQEPIPHEITKLTGISNDMVADAPIINDCIGGFIEFLGSDILLGHNIASFDSNILYDNALGAIDFILKNDYVDTLNYARHCDLELPDYKLTTIQDYFNVENTAQHRSLSDCIATHECYQKMKPLLRSKSTVSSGSNSKKKRVPNADTQAINVLNGLLTGITCDDILNACEVYALRAWVDNNRQLSGTYPFDMVFTEIEKALEDGVLEKKELDFMLDVFKSIIDPVETFSSTDNCAQIDFTGKLICLTGDFENFDSRTEAEEYFSQKGAILKGSVVKKLDYLIVGGCGSENWSCGKYGNKVKKALELQSQGAPVKILKEEDIWND